MPQQSVTDAVRIESVDALRGFALAGVCLVHMMEQYYAAPPPALMTEVAMAGLADKILAGANQLLFVGKFYALFSLLFGLSFYIQYAAAIAKGAAFYGRFAWRLTLLLGFGFLHHLFYRGDILMLYAAIGLLLIPLNHLSNRWLLILALFMFAGGGRYISYGIFGSASIFGSPGLDTGSPVLDRYFDTLRTGTLSDVFAENAVSGLQAKLDFLFGIFGRAFSTFGLFIMGIYIGRCGFFSELAKSRDKLRKYALWGLTVCLVSIAMAFGLFSRVEMPPTFNSWLEMFALTAFDGFNLGLATLIACGFLALGYSRQWRGFPGWFTPYGRMALSNYLFQALVGTFIFYGWGLAQLAQWRALYCVLAGIALIGLQILLSHYWLQRYHYGPAEWLWRSLTYFTMVPFKKEA